jgi:apolipoprotein N-acyltransferase
MSDEDLCSSRWRRAAVLFACACGVLAIVAAARAFPPPSQWLYGVLFVVAPVSVILVFAECACSLGERGPGPHQELLLPVDLASVA